MSLIQKLGTGQGYLKAGFLGFQGSGKTFTAMLLALGLRKFLKLEGPVAMFDTEGGSEYIAERIKKETGEDLVGVRARSLGDLLTMGRECVEGEIPILIVDSMTHPWREVCDAYLQQVNAIRAANHKSPRSRLEFQDWAAIKAKFGEWTEFYLNSAMHIIICGRAGFDWDFQTTTDDAGKERRELIKTGIKMKTENEFGFEPALLIEMERVQLRENGQLAKEFTHRATVLKDKFGNIDA